MKDSLSRAKKKLTKNEREIRDKNRKKVAQTMFSFCTNHSIKFSYICSFIGLNSKTVSSWNREITNTAPDREFSLPAPDEPVTMTLINSEAELSVQQNQVIENLRSTVVAMEHGTKRTKGSKEVHDTFSSVISRRVIDSFINDERAALNKQKKDACTRIKWRMPMTCLSFDDTWVYTKESGEKVYIHNIKDLASQYILPPVAGPMLTGKEVAKNLENLFIQYGAPLFLKRDNGGNLDCKEVNQVLYDFNVIPLNSPEYYSPYNGSIEQCNYWIKEQLKEVAEKTKCPINDDTVMALARLAAHEENIKQRRVLNRQRAVETFWLGGRERSHLRKTQRNYIRDMIDKRERELLEKEIAKAKFEKVLNKKDKKRIKRKAVEEILEERGYIDITKPETRVSTN